jgi:hypothetical protein
LNLKEKAALAEFVAVQLVRGPWFTSDHPVVLWPKSMPSRQTKKGEDFVECGILDTLEARFPVSPPHAS